MVHEEKRCPLSAGGVTYDQLAEIQATKVLLIRDVALEIAPAETSISEDRVQVFAVTPPCLPRGAD